MSTYDQTQAEEDFTNTYHVSHLEGIVGEITPLDQTEKIPVILKGEIVIVGQETNGQFRPTNISRLALHGHPQTADSKLTNQLRTIDLVGPLNYFPLEREGENRWFTELHMRLYYSKIGGMFNEIADETLHPPAEMVAGYFAFNVEEGANRDQVSIKVDMQPFEIEEIIEEGGLIQAVMLDLGQIELKGPGDPPPSDAEPANSLRASCDQTNPQFKIKSANCGDGNATKQREIGLKFINLSEQDTDDVEAWCQLQLDEVCRVWCRKGALDLRVQQQVETAVHAGHQLFVYEDWDVIDMGTWQDYKSDDHIEIFIVDELETTLGSGQAETRLAGTAETYAILDARAINTSLKLGGFYNPMLLAHELCHILGLNHPNESLGKHSFPGEAGSITETALPNSTRNTGHNLSIFSRSQLNAKVKHKLNQNNQSIPACFIPDP